MECPWKVSFLSFLQVLNRPNNMAAVAKNRKRRRVSKKVFSSKTKEPINAKLIEGFFGDLYLQMAATAKIILTLDHMGNSV